MKVLVNLFTSELSESQIIDLSEPFETNGYLIYNLQFRITDCYLDIIDNVLDYLSIEYRVERYSSKMVLQSNIKNLMLAWYRLYNDVIDDFILIDQSICDFKSNDFIIDGLINQLSTFSAIENDMCHRRFYYRYTHPISRDLLRVVVENYQYDLLKSFKDLDLHAVYEKKRIRKKYNYKNYGITLGIDEEPVELIIDLEKQTIFNNDILLNKITHPSAYFTLFNYTFNSSVSQSQKNRISLLLHREMNKEDKLKLSDNILTYLSICESELSFKQIMNYLSLLALLGTEKTILKKMLSYIKNDNSSLDYHYALLTYSLFYSSNAGQDEYGTYFLDRVEIMSNLKAYYKTTLNIETVRHKNHLVIVCGQLLSYTHSPTKVVIDYANNLMKYYPNLKIKIVVEDMFCYSPNELFFVYEYFATESRTVFEEHRKLLHPSIMIHYSNKNLARKERLQDDVNRIVEFKPQWIMKMGAPDSLLVDQLYDYYPVSSLSMGGAEYSEFVDVNFGGRCKEYVFEERLEKGLVNTSYIYHQLRLGLEFEKSNICLERRELGLRKDNFVIVTVGNRLKAEMDIEFIKGMKAVLKDHSHAKWLIIGLESHPLIECSQQVKFINYAEDLISIYSICDIFANPFREGGGMSVAMALFAGIPVVNIEGLNDANVYVPKQKVQTKESYFDYIDKLIKDVNFYNAEKGFIHNRIKKDFGFEKSVNMIAEFNLEAESKYMLRRENSIQI